MDLRRTAVVHLARAGCSVPEIAAITGHSVSLTVSILEVYLPRDSEMAAAAISKLCLAAPKKRDKLNADRNPLILASNATDFLAVSCGP